MVVRLAVAKSPTEAAALSNKVYISPIDARALSLSDEYAHVVLRTDSGQTARVSLAIDGAVAQGDAAFSGAQRVWLQLALGDAVFLDPMQPVKPTEAGGNVHLQAANLSVDLVRRGAANPDAPPVDTDRLATTLLQRLGTMVLNVGQPLLVDFVGQSLMLRVVSLERIDFEIPVELRKNKDALSPAEWGVLGKTELTFRLAEEGPVRLAGSKCVHASAAMGPDFRFEDMGIGGLDDEFWTIFRRAFVSRIYPPELVKRLGVRHVKGLVLYGPPGTGKTLMARQIAKMLQAREPKIVNGPEILNKYVGQSEENVRALFKDAEAEYKAKGDASALHIIIFDELDAICKQRGGRADGTGVGDSVVNQLLAKMDGVEELHNILVIGMTNRLDLIDDALLRPGRFEVKLEIPLPDRAGRLQILRIHTAAMRTANALEDADVLLDDVAERTHNFTGAELVGLINSATSFALNRHVLVDGRPSAAGGAASDGASKKPDAKDRGVRVDKMDECRVTRLDFERALAENKAAYGVDEDEFAAYGHGAVDTPFSPAMRSVVDDARLVVRQIAAHRGRPALSTLLLHGPAGSGKSAVGARLALDSGFPFVKVLSTHSLIAAGGSEAAKVAWIAKLFEDAYRSPLSFVLVDDLEDVVEYVDIGPRFASGILATLKAYLKRTPPPPSHRVLVVATTRDLSLVRRLGLADLFRAVLAVPTITAMADLTAAIRRASQSSPELISSDTCSAVIDAVITDTRPFSIPVRTLTEILETAAQDPSDASLRFIEAFERYRVGDL